VIIRLDNIPVNTVNELQEQVGKHRPGDKVSVTYIRNGKENTVPVTLKNIANNTSVITPGMGIGVVYGARLETLSSYDKRLYNVDYGTKIIDLGDGRFKDIGLKKGTIILSINGKKVRNAEDIRTATNNENILKSIEGYYSDGTHFDYKYGN
jgi:S1-C subfamily serine protease